jgi:hypothetical protein
MPEGNNISRDRQPQGESQFPISPLIVPRDVIDSPDWITIDGLMMQNRPWLLELFQWTLDKKQTILRAAR